MVKGNKFKASGNAAADSPAAATSAVSPIGPVKAGKVALSGAQRKKKAKLNALTRETLGTTLRAQPACAPQQTVSPSAAAVVRVPSAAGAKAAGAAEAVAVPGTKRKKPTISGATRRKLGRAKAEAAALANGGAVETPSKSRAKRTKTSPGNASGPSAKSAAGGESLDTIIAVQSAAAQANARRKARATAKRLERRKQAKAAAATAAAGAAGTSFEVPAGASHPARIVTPRRAETGTAQAPVRPTVLGDAAAGHIDTPEARASQSGAVLATASTASALFADRKLANGDAVVSTAVGNQHIGQTSSGAITVRPAGKGGLQMAAPTTAHFPAAAGGHPL